MVQILPQYNEGTALGSALGQSLGQGIQQYRQQQQQAPVFEALGYQPEVAQRLALLDPKVQQTVLKNMQNAQFTQSLAQNLGMDGGGILPQPPMQTAMPQTQIQQPGVLQQVIPEQARELPQQPVSQMQQSQIGKIPSGLTPEQALRYVEMMQRNAMQKMEFANKKQMQDIKQSTDRWKVMKKDVDSITGQYDAALENKARIGAITKLSEAGAGGSGSRFIKSLSEAKIFKAAPLGFLAPLAGPDAEVIDKLSNDFLKNAAQAAGGGRITNTFLNTYLKTFPNLMQSPQGRIAVGYILNKFQDAKIIEYKAMQKILDENNGVPPFDLKQRINKEAGKQLDKIYKDIGELNLQGLSDSINKATRSIQKKGFFSGLFGDSGAPKVGQFTE